MLDSDNFDSIIELSLLVIDKRLKNIIFDQDVDRALNSSCIPYRHIKNLEFSWCKEYPLTKLPYTGLAD